MSKVAIVTDSNSGITQKRGEELGIYVLPMPFFIDGELYLEDITLSQEQFYERLAQDVDISTSQPSPEDVTKAWEELLEENESIVYIPMSSGLSGSCQTAIMLADDYEAEQQELELKITRLSAEISDTEEQSDNLERFISKIHKYLDLQELTPSILNDMVKRVYVHAPQIIDGKRTQQIDICYDLVGILPMSLLKQNNETA